MGIYELTNDFVMFSEDHVFEVIRGLWLWHQALQSKIRGLTTAGSVFGILYIQVRTMKKHVKLTSTGLHGTRLRVGQGS